MSAPTPRPLATPIDAGARTQHSDGPEAAATAIIESLGLRVASASATGTRHTVNEDACSALERAGRLFVVADGVGGGAFAAFASRDLVAGCPHALSVPRRRPRRSHEAPRR